MFYFQLAIAFIFMGIALRTAWVYSQPEEIEEPEPESLIDGDYLWSYQYSKYGHKTGIKLIHSPTGNGITASVVFSEDSKKIIVKDLQGNEIDLGLIHVPTYNFEFVEKEMKRYLEGKIPKPKAKPEPVLSIEDYTPKPYVVLKKGVEMEDIVGGRKIGLFGLFKGLLTR